MDIALRGLLSSDNIKLRKTRIQNRRGQPAELVTLETPDDDIYDVLVERPEHGLPR
jgi:hypothetical protein